MSLWKVAVDAPLPVAPQVRGAPPRLLLVRAPYYQQVIDRTTTASATTRAH